MATAYFHCHNRSCPCLSYLLVFPPLVPALPLGLFCCLPIAGGCCVFFFGGGAF